MGRPPGFPSLLAASFLPAGPSIVAAAWAVRILGFVAILALGALASRMFGIATAILAILWAVPNEFINEHLSHVILLDMAQAAFLLLFILFTHRAFKSDSLLKYGVAAVSLGAAFWIKESALLFLPLPFFVLLLAPGNNSKKRLLGLLVYSCVAALLILPWFAVVFIESGSLYRTYSISGLQALLLSILIAAVLAVSLAPGLRWLLSRSRSESPMGMVNHLVSRRLPRYCALLLLVLLGVVLGGAPLPAEIWNHFGERVSLLELKPLGFMAWILIPLSWLITLRHALRSSLPDAILVAAFLCSVPLIIFVIDRNLDPRNYLLFFMLSHLVIARVIVNGFLGLWRSNWSRGNTALRYTTEITVGLGIGLLLAPPLIMLGSDLKFAGSGPDISAANDIDNSTVMASWIQENLPPGELVHILGSTAGATTRFELGNAYRSMWVQQELIQEADLSAGLSGSLPGFDSDLRPYKGLSGLVFVDFNPSTYVGVREAQKPEFIVLQIPDIVNGRYPNYLVWTQTGAERVLPDALLSFLEATNVATELVRWDNGDKVLKLVEPQYEDVLLVNVRVLEKFYDRQEDILILPSEMATNLSQWSVVIIGERNDGEGSEVGYCSLLEAVADIGGCWNGVSEYPVPLS